MSAARWRDWRGQADGITGPNAAEHFKMETHAPGGTFMPLGKHTIIMGTDHRPEDGQRCIAIVPLEEPDGEANAALIAAAPALADALEPFANAEPKDDDLCHRGLTTKEKCGRCRLVLVARAALRAAGRLP